MLDALHKWGRQAFDALFDNRQGADFLRDAQEGGRYDRLTLQVASDDPRILAWPWEAIEDRQSGLLAHTCQIERRVDQVANPPPLDERLPRNRVNILLVTARPYPSDVRLRSISRPLVELINQRNLPAQVTILRPPTFDQLRGHLHDHPHTYHVLHFDGHGGYGDDHSDHTHHAGSHCYQGRGVLVFEKPDGSPDEIAADQLTNLLREFAVPAVVLNACQSAMIDEHAADPFASVAAALLKSGTRSVVAMAYSLYVSAARRFVPAFYERLFESGDSAEAVRAGRQQMFAQKGRICARGEFPLEDWLVPVVYPQDPLDFSFAAKAMRKKKEDPDEPGESKLPPEARDTENPYGFIGRDCPPLELQRAMLRLSAAILIQGLGGVGKSTLAREFAKWLELTGGLGAGCLWLDFRDIRTAYGIQKHVHAKRELQKATMWLERINPLEVWLPRDEPEQTLMLHNLGFPAGRPEGRVQSTNLVESTINLPTDAADRPRMLAGRRYWFSVGDGGIVAGATNDSAASADTHCYRPSWQMIGVHLMHLGGRSQPVRVAETDSTPTTGTRSPSTPVGDHSARFQHSSPYRADPALRFGACPNV